MVPENAAWIETPDIAINFLHFAAKDYENAKSMRLYYAQAARRHGITNAQIGSIYGMTEAGVRMMINRAGEKS